MDRVVFTGMHLGKGMVGAVQLLSTSSATTLNVNTDPLLTDANTGVSYMNNVFVREIRSPAGGVM